jgi:hypothetical protein
MKRTVSQALPRSRTLRPMHLVRAFLAAGILSMLIGGVWSGLLRMGWALPAPHQTLAPVHGPLFVCGMLGAVIGLERAVAIRRAWAFAGPLLTFIGGVALLIGVPTGLSALLISSGSLGLLAIFGAIVRRQPVRFTITMALGAVAWFGGNLFWLSGRPLALASLWWAGFLILTIVGERLELGRLRHLPRQAWWSFAVGVALVPGSLVLASIAMDAGMRLAGVSFIVLGAWLLQYDIARRTVRRTGLPRFSAVCILSGSLWLIIGGALALIFGATYAGPIYDALLHALFVGFVFAMIFGHAPIIIPALLNLPVRFRAWHYLPLLVLHLSLLIRISGDLIGSGDVRRWGGMLNGLAILLFLIVTVISVWQGRQHAAVVRETPIDNLPLLD